MAALGWAALDFNTWQGHTQHTLQMRSFPVPQSRVIPQECSQTKVFIHTPLPLQ